MVLYSPGRTTNYPESPPNKGIRYHYLGGANEVGNVGCLFEDSKGERMLLDYGLAPTDPPRYPQECPPVKNAVITHSHIDHLGMAPWLCANHRTNLHGTQLTAEISRMMWNDCYKVSRIEGYPLAWDKRDIDGAVSSWKTHRFGDTWTNNNWKLTLERAGHIPGAAMLNVETDTHKLLFTGDFDTRNSQLTLGAKPIKTDILFIEGTYGGREHPKKEENLDSFINRVVEITDRGGTALIPAFANGRTQDMVMTLHKHLPELEVHVDGMGKHVAKLQMENPEALRDPKALQDAWKWCRRVSSKSDKKKALNADCIVSTSGMLDGGPSIWYLNRLKDDERNGVIFTGYQAEGSGGRSLLEKRVVPIWGKPTNIDLEVNQFSFSTHAGHSQIVEFSAACEAETVIIYHSDPNTARPLLVEDLEKNGHTVHTPTNGISHIIE